MATSCPYCGGQKFGETHPRAKGRLNDRGKWSQRSFVNFCLNCEQFSLNDEDTDTQLPLVSPKNRRSKIDS